MEGRGVGGRCRCFDETRLRRTGAPRVRSAVLLSPGVECVGRVVMLEVDEGGGGIAAGSVFGGSSNNGGLKLIAALMNPWKYNIVCSKHLMAFDPSRPRLWRLLTKKLR